MPNVFPDDILRRLRELEKKVGIGPATEDVDIPFFAGTATDAQILIYQVPPGPAPPPAWAAVTMSGDATIDDLGVLTLTATPPLLLDYLAAYDDGTGTAVATNVFHISTFTVNAPNTSGSDIEIAPSGIHTGWPTINTDGIYAVNVWLRSQADTAADTFNWAQFVVSILRGGAGRYGPAFVQAFAPALLASNKHYAEASFSWTGILNAGNVIEAQALMGGGGAGTWSVTGGFVQIDRIA